MRRTDRQANARHRPSSSGPMSFAGMLIRSRASAAASAIRLSSSPSSSLDKQQLDVRRLRLAVAREAIAAEREGERRKARIVRRVGEAVDAGRQQSRQLARPERIAPFRALVLQAEQHVVDAAAGRRQQQALARLGLEGGGLDELSRRRTERLGDAPSDDLVTKVMGVAVVPAGTSKTGCMLLSTLDETSCAKTAAPRCGAVRDWRQLTRH